MSDRVCFHCKRLIPAGEPHDCWSTTEDTLLRGLSADLRDAYDRLRDTAVEFGEQRIYASHKSIMFSRRACYFFVRPKTKYLEICFFLGRRIEAAQIRRIAPASQSKFAHTVRVVHRDEVEAPLTRWLLEAYEFGEAPAPRARR